MLMRMRWHSDGARPSHADRCFNIGMLLRDAGNGVGAYSALIEGAHGEGSRDEKLLCLNAAISAAEAMGDREKVLAVRGMLLAEEGTFGIDQSLVKRLSRLDLKAIQDQDYVR